MFGRQITDEDDQSQLNDEQAAYMQDLTAPHDDNSPVLPTEASSAPSLDTSLSGAPEVNESDNTDLVGSSIPRVSVVNHDELLDIKQSALNELSPLVGHLDQSAEEKFRTTMMLIQASDNSTLIGSAYNAAKNISDDKSRAQALLDVVNEINYFTNKHHTN